MKPNQFAGMLACGAALASTKVFGQTTLTTFTLEAAGCIPASSTGTGTLTDCGSALSSFLTSTTVSGIGTTSLEFDGTPGKFYYFKTSWTMPANVTLNLQMDASRRPENGVWGLNNTSSSTSSWGPGFGGILLDTGVTIIMTDNDTVENGACVNYNLPTPATPAAALTAIQQSFTGTCVTISPNKVNGLYGSDDLVRDIAIVGFNTGIAEISTSPTSTISGRLGIENVYCDATTCVDDRYAQDFSHIRTLYANNLYAGVQLKFPVASPYTYPPIPGGTLCSGPGTYSSTLSACNAGLHPGILAYRAGPLINVEATSDDLDITDIESYGHQTAVCARDVYVLSIHGLKSEINAQTVAGTTPIYGTMTATTYGIIALGNTNLLLSGGFEFGGRTYGLYLTNYGGNVVANGTVQVGGGSNADYVYIAPPNASTPTCLSTISPTGTGTVAGNFSNVTFKGPSPVFAIGAATNVSITNSTFNNTGTPVSIDSSSSVNLTMTGNSYINGASTLSMITTSTGSMTATLEGMIGGYPSAIQPVCTTFPAMGTNTAMWMQLARTSMVEAFAVGGGGGGGTGAMLSAGGSGGGGGGGGDQGILPPVPSSSIGNSVVVRVGVGGAPGAQGTTSDFGNSLSAGGGGGGAAGSAALSGGGGGGGALGFLGQNGTSSNGGTAGLGGSAGGAGIASASATAASGGSGGGGSSATGTSGAAGQSATGAGGGSAGGGYTGSSWLAGSNGGTTWAKGAVGGAAGTLTGGSCTAGGPGAAPTVWPANAAAAGGGGGGGSSSGTGCAGGTGGFPGGGGGGGGSGPSSGGTGGIGANGEVVVCQW